MRSELQITATSPEYDSDMRAAAAHILAYYVFVSSIVLDQTATQAEAYQHSYTGLLRPSEGNLSSLIQRRYMLQLRAFAHNTHVHPCRMDEMQELCQALPPHERHTEQWFHLSEYYFNHSHAAGVSEAYENYMLHCSSWAKDYSWRRLDVMSKLLAGTATRRDAELLIQAMVVPGCAKEIRRSFWPQFVHCGLADDELAVMLDTRITEMRRQLAHPALAGA